MKKIIKDILILCIITVICGGVLGYVYQITLSPIEKQAQQSQQDAYLEQLKNNYGKNGITIEKALKSFKQKEGIGYIIQVVDHDGFGGDIEIIVGINLQKEITGVEILSIDETVGLGMNAKNEEFRNQYVGKKGDHFQVVKNGKQNDPGGPLAGRPRPRRSGCPAPVPGRPPEPPGPGRTGRSRPPGGGDGVSW